MHQVTHTEPNSPIARVLSGRYTLIVRRDLEGGRVESCVTGEQSIVYAHEVSDILAYRCVRMIDEGAGGFRYGTDKAKRLWVINRKRSA